MPDPSWNSYKAAVGRYHKRAVTVRAAFDADGTLPPADEVAAINKESRRLDEVRDYLTTRQDGESLKQWRTRQRPVAQDPRLTLV